MGQQQDRENQEWRLRTREGVYTWGSGSLWTQWGSLPSLQEAGLSPRESSQAEPTHGPQAETTPVTN